MPNAVKDQIESLVKLQNIEVEADSIKSMLKSIPEKLAALDAELVSFEEGLSKEGIQIEELKKKYRDQEREVQENATRIKKSQEKLHSVKNNKEYQSLLKEIDDLNGINSSIEDLMLENLDLLDAAEQSIAGKQEALASLSRDIRDEKAHIQQNADEKQARLSELEKRRDEMREIIGQELLDTFNIVKKKHSGGLAIVSVSNAVCSGCNVNLPPQMYNELQRIDSLRFCPNCQRIVYWHAN